MEEMLDVKNIIFHILRKWKSLIGVAVVVATLGGINTYISSTNILTDEEALEKYEANFFEENRLYMETKTEYEQYIQILENSIESTEKYLNESILMTIDPYNHNIGYLDIYVDSLYEINPQLYLQTPNKIYSIMKSYDTRLRNTVLYEKIADGLGIDIAVKYIKEIVRHSYNIDTGYITFTIVMNEVSDIEKIADIITEFIYDNYESINQEIAEHTINVYDVNPVLNIDEGLKNNQQNHKFDISDEQTKLEYTQYSLKALKQPIKVEFNNIYSINEGIKAFIIYGVVTGIIGVGFIVIGYLLSKKLQSIAYLEDKYKILALAVRPITQNRSNKIDNMIFKMIDTDIKSEEKFKEYLSVISQKIANPNQKIHITGTIDIKDIKEIHEIITTHTENTITFGGFITKDEQSMYSLRDADVVVLVEKRFDTSTINLDRQIKYIQNLEKDICGVVLL